MVDGYGGGGGHAVRDGAAAKNQVGRAERDGGVADGSCWGTF